MRKTDIDVVLTVYKRPECLQEQLNAIKGQSIEPQNIYLYQDAIDSYYKIQLKKDILREFKNIKIAYRNGGVWKRFEYAREIAKSTYVCIFDDDTIPGRRWLENCFLQMQSKEGIFGTNGILLSNIDEYPFGSDDIRIGWVNPNQNTMKVDFVGHSWFLKTEWLDYMFTNMVDLQKKYKYVGEDMCLSYQCYLNNIDTYVPPHPYDMPELWGSMPSYAKVYGNLNSAVSANSYNHEEMNKVLKELRAAGWKIICERERDYYCNTVATMKKSIMNKNEYILNKLYKFCDKSKKIYLYGVGEYGKLFYHYLTNQKIAIEGFVVSDLTKIKANKCYNVPILDIDNFLRKKEESTVILSLSEFFHNEVRNRLDLKSNINIYPLKNDNIIYEDLIKALRDYSLCNDI